MLAALTKPTATARGLDSGFAKEISFRTLLAPVSLPPFSELVPLTDWRDNLDVKRDIKDWRFAGCSGLVMSISANSGWAEWTDSSDRVCCIDAWDGRLVSGRQRRGRGCSRSRDCDSRTSEYSEPLAIGRNLTAEANNCWRSCTWNPTIVPSMAAYEIALWAFDIATERWKMGSMDGVKRICWQKITIGRTAKQEIDWGESRARHRKRLPKLNPLNHTFVHKN